MKIDQTNIDIIKHMQEGRKSFKKIADELGISENTVRSRVVKLEEDGILEISGFVDPGSLPGHKIVFVGVKLGTLNLVEKAKEFSKLRGVVSVSVVTGRYDLILIVLLKEGFELLQFYTEEVYRLEDVRSVETFVVYKGYNLKVPYIL